MKLWRVRKRKHVVLVKYTGEVRYLIELEDGHHVSSTDGETATELRPRLLIFSKVGIAPLYHINPARASRVNVNIED